MQGRGDVEKAREAIQDFRRRGRYIEGHDYIIRLPQKLRQQARVAIEISQLYLVQGHWIRAWEACSLSNLNIFKDGDPSAGFTPEICDQHSVCLALLSAYIGICRHGMVKSALHIAGRVHDAWLTPNLEDFPVELSRQIPDEVRENFVTIVMPQWTALQKCADGWGRDVVAISESRVLIEFYYYRIRVVAAEQGLLEEAGTKRDAANRLDVLREWTISRNRLREARYLTYFRIGLADNNAEDLEVLQEFLRTISTTNHRVEEAQTRLDLARCMIRSRDLQLRAEAQEHIRKAEELFHEEEHVFGVLDLRDMQLSEEKDSISLKDTLDRKLQLAEAYFERACYQQGIRCLIFAVPVSHDMDEISQKTQSIIERIQAEIACVGGVILEQALYITAVAQALLRAPEYGYARKSLEDYLDRLPSEIGPKILGALYACLIGAYTNVGDLDKALFYAEQALAISLEGASYKDISDAAFARAITRLQRGRRFPPKSVISQIWLASSIAFLKVWVEIDRVMCYHEQEVEKYAWLASAENEMGLSSDDEQAFTRSDRWLKAARQCSEINGISSSKIRELEIVRATRVQDFDLAVGLAHDQIRILQAASYTTPFALAQATTIASTTTYGRFCHRLQAATHQTGVDYGPIIQDLNEAVKLASKAFDLYGVVGGSEMIVTALNWLYELVRHFPAEDRRDLMRFYLTEAEKIEVFCDAVRRSSATTRDVGSLFEKRGIISGKEYRNLYTNAIEACMDLEDAPAAWVWIQKSKARALSDVFGVRALIPGALLQTIATDEEAQMLYEKERLSTEFALKAGPLDYINARRKAESDHTEMRKHPLLAMVLDIREGAFNVDFHESELNEAMELCNVSREAIKYVDWFIPTFKGRENKIMLLVRQLDGVTRSKILEITITTVEAWIRRVFEFPEEAEPPLRRGDARRKLLELAPLVQGLEQLTNEEDLLILSPSGPLNRIPIHALPLGKRTLIERNPVVYSASAAIFRQCHMRSAAQASKYNDHARKAAFLAVYESSTTEGQRERSKIYEHADKVSNSSFPFAVRKGTAVTKSSFREVAHESPWVHYHGHALFDKVDVLRACLVLSDGTDQTQTISPIGSAIDPKHLTVADIFSIDMLNNAPHFTVIACDSGTQDIATGDEPLGIIPALLYAGATSALGTLWPVDSHTARSFTEIFYDNLRQQMEAQPRQEPTSPRFLVLNLAAALRITVRKMMDRNNQDTKAPLHWAAYVLHGAWFHLCPWPAWRENGQGKSRDETGTGI